MADTKITGLQTPGAFPVVPSTDVLPIVIVADNSMAASGSTRKVTVNQILGAGGTATLASATITGDLTVDTNTLKVDSANDVVLIGSATKATYGANKLEVRGLNIASPGSTNVGNLSILTTDSQAIDKGGTLALGGGFDTTTPYAFAVIAGRKETSTNANAQGYLQFLTTNSGNSIVERYRISGDGVATWSNVGGVAGTAMTLNATGLGVGVAPELKLRVDGPDAAPATSGSSTTNGAFRIGAQGASTNLCVDAGVTTTGAVYGWFQARSRANYATNYDIVLNPNGGNVGIGLTPIASHILSCSGPLALAGTAGGTRTSYISNNNACSIYYTDGGGSGYFVDYGNLIIQPRTSAARSVVIATGSTTPVERAVVKSTGQVRFVPLAADPAGAEAGDVYYNSTSNKLKCYNGTTWNDLF